MKSIKFVLLCALFGIILNFFSIPAFGMPADTSPEKELRVRVYLDEIPVVGLEKEQFNLYENKNLVSIDQIEMTKQRIGNSSKAPIPPRYFVLIFDITDHDNASQESLSFILDHMLTPKDQLLIAANGQTLFFKDLSKKEKVRSNINHFLDIQSKQSRQQMIAELASVEKLMDLIRTRSSRETERHGQGAVHLHYYMKYIKFSLEQYINALKAYKSKYLSMGIDKYYYLLRPLASIKRNKWVFRFFRMPIIPELTGKNRAMLKKLIRDLADSTWNDELYYSELFSKMLAEIDDLFHSAAEFPIDEMSRLFNHLDAVFHSVILTNSNGQVSKDHKQKKLLTDIESSLIEIALRSGGSATALLSPSTGKQIPLDIALKTIQEREDICYTLSFSPQTSEKPEKIHIETKNKNHRVYLIETNSSSDFSQFLNKEQNGQSSSLQLKNSNFKNKILSFNISGFLLQKTDKGETGQIVARIYIYDKKNDLISFDQSKSLLPQKDSIHISLNFSWLLKGNYSIGLEVHDQLTGQRDLQIVPGKVR